MTNTIYDAAEKYLFAANRLEQAQRDLDFLSESKGSAENELLNLLSEEEMKGSVTIVVNRLYGVQINDLGTITAHAKKVDLLDVSKPVNPEPHYKDLELDLSYCDPIENG